MTIRAFGVVSSTVGTAVCRVRTTMSMGFSKKVAFGLMAATSTRFSGTGVCSLIALSVISASGVEFRCACRGDAGEGEGLGVFIWVFSDGSFSFSLDSGSGDSDGCGVGSAMEGASDMVDAIDSLVFLFARTLSRTLFRGARLRGDGFFVGDDGGSDAGGLNICDGSTDSLILVRRRVDLGGAGVNSSSLLRTLLASSSSDSSIIFFREAARRDGRDGDAADMFVD
jgi:hypothetical protein